MGSGRRTRIQAATSSSPAPKSSPTPAPAAAPLMTASAGRRAVGRCASSPHTRRPTAAAAAIRTAAPAADAYAARGLGTRAQQCQRQPGRDHGQARRGHGPALPAQDLRTRPGLVPQHRAQRAQQDPEIGAAHLARQPERRDHAIGHGIGQPVLEDVDRRGERPGRPVLRGEDGEGRARAARDRCGRGRPRPRAATSPRARPTRGRRRHRATRRAPTADAPPHVAAARTTGASPPARAARQRRQRQGGDQEREDRGHRAPRPRTPRAHATGSARGMSRVRDQSRERAWCGGARVRGARPAASTSSTPLAHASPRSAPAPAVPLIVDRRRQAGSAGGRRAGSRGARTGARAAGSRHGARATIRRT